MRQAAMALGLSTRDRMRLIEVPLALPSILRRRQHLRGHQRRHGDHRGVHRCRRLWRAHRLGACAHDNATLLAGAIPAAALALMIQGAFEIGERRFGWMARAKGRS